jgi:hypothetical protein
MRRLFLVPVARPMAKRPHWRFAQVVRRLPTQKVRRLFAQRGATPVAAKKTHRWFDRPKALWRPARKRRSMPLFTATARRRMSPAWVCARPQKRIVRVARKRFAKITIPQRLIRHRPQQWVRKGPMPWRARPKAAFPLYPQKPARNRLGPKLWRRRQWFPPNKGPKRCAIAPPTIYVPLQPLCILEPSRVLASPGKIRLLRRARF